MTADELRTALRVLKAGRPAHNIYEIEDAAAAIEPFKRAYWRMHVSVMMVATILVLAIIGLTHAPTWLAAPIAMMSPNWLISVRAFRDKLLPVRGLGSAEILRAAMQ